MRETNDNAERAIYYGNDKDLGALYFSAIRGDEGHFWPALNFVLCSRILTNRLFLNIEPVFYLVPGELGADRVSILTLLTFYGHQQIISQLPKKLRTRDLSYQHLLRWNRYQAFYWACKKTHNEIVALLFEQCDYRSQHKILQCFTKSAPYQAFADAAMANKFSTLKLLLELCAPEYRQQLIKAGGYCAFSYACGYGNEEIIDLLWETCDPKHRQKMLTTGSHTPIKWAFDCSRQSPCRFPNPDIGFKLLLLYSKSSLRGLGIFNLISIIEKVKEDIQLSNFILRIAFKLMPLESRYESNCFFRLIALCQGNLNPFILPALYCPKQLDLYYSDLGGKKIGYIIEILKLKGPLSRVIFHMRDTYPGRPTFNFRPLLQAIITYAPSVSLIFESSLSSTKQKLYEKMGFTAHLEQSAYRCKTIIRYGFKLTAKNQLFHTLLQNETDNSVAPVRKRANSI